MKHYILTIAVLPILFLAACTPANPPTTDDPGTQQPSVNNQEDAGGAMMKKEELMEKSEGTMVKSSDAMEKENTMTKAGEYKDFTASNLPASILADGKTKVLFFHASWCPSCKRANQTLTSWYTDGEGMLTVYKINYDEEKPLKQKYSVTYQHTFVKVDGRGDFITLVTGPSDDELKALLKA